MSFTPFSPFRGFGGGVANTPLILDIYPAAAAYSLRKLQSSSAFVLRARAVGGANDAVEADFTASQITNGDLAAWATESAFVTKLYDQSGNANHLVQAVSSRQPRIVNGGVVETSAGKPTISFDGNTYLISLGNVTWPNTAALAVIAQATTLTPPRGIVGSGSAGATVGMQIWHFLTELSAFSAKTAGYVRIGIPANTAANHLLAYRDFGETKLKLETGSSSEIALGVPSNVPSPLYFGSISADYRWIGYGSEVIKWDSFTSDAATQVRADALSHYAL